MDPLLEKSRARAEQQRMSEEAEARIRGELRRTQLSMVKREVIWKQEPPVIGKADGLSATQREKLAELRKAQAEYLAALERLLPAGDVSRTARAEFERAAMWAAAAVCQ